MVKKFLIGGVLLAMVVPVAAQSLADVARAEEARRKAVTGQAKVYTNETLRGVDGGPPRRRLRSPRAGLNFPRYRRQARSRCWNQTSRAAGSRCGERREVLARPADSRARCSLPQSEVRRCVAESDQWPLHRIREHGRSDQRAIIEKKRLAAIAEQDRVKGEVAKQTKALADKTTRRAAMCRPAGSVRPPSWRPPSSSSKTKSRCGRC